MRYICEYCKQVWEEDELDGQPMCPECLETMQKYNQDEDYREDYDDQYDDYDEDYDDQFDDKDYYDNDKYRNRKTKKKYDEEDEW